MWRVIAPRAAPLAEPLSADEFDQSMARFGPFSGGIALAVSGGPDSMALAYLAQRWAERHRLAIKAFIVDHALRSTSSVEAKATQKQLENMGVQGEILRWDHEKLVSKLHITARKARYRLLIEASKNERIYDLLLAHQLEDQAETVLMRLAKGSGIDGLAGMAAKNEVDGVRLLRPFLDVPKDRLIATCRIGKISFITDPSNHSEKFARGRLRRVLPLLSDEGLTIERLADLASRAGDAKDALDHFTNLLLRVGSKQTDAGVIHFDLEQLRASPRAVALRAVAIVLQSVHAEDYAPEQISLAALLDALLADTDMTPRTLHGCLISKNAAEATFIREVSAITENLSVEPGESVIWDGRWQLTLSTSLKDIFAVRPLGNPPHELVDKLAPDLRKKVPQGRARAGLPALWMGENLILIPSLAAAPGENNPATARLLKPWPPR